MTRQDGQTAIDVGSDADDVKEALLAYRFSAEEVEDDFLQERLPGLVERVTVSGVLWCVCCAVLCVLVCDVICCDMLCAVLYLFS